MRIFLFLPIMLMVDLAHSQSSSTRFYNPPNNAKPNGYSHAAVVDLGTSILIITSGQVALDSSGNLIGKADMGKQAEQVFKNIKNIIEPFGGNMSDIIKLTYFITDVSKIQAVRDARDKFITIPTPPASSLVQVSKLFRDDVLIEIEATIIISKK